jgi:uncharacterized phiE125 gp8 family phage protein
MGLTLVTGPALEPVSLIEAKQHCRIDSTDDDGLLAGYILAARSYAEDYTRRAFITQTWDYRISNAYADNPCVMGWPAVKQGDTYYPRIELPKPPLISVTSITYVDTAGVSQTLAADQYQVNPYSYTGLIDPAYGVTWPQVRTQMNAITVRFVCGHGSNPGNGQELERVRQAMLLMIGHWYENREAVNVGNIVNELPFGVNALLFPLRVFY